VVMAQVRLVLQTGVILIEDIVVGLALPPPAAAKFLALRDLAAIRHGAVEGIFRIFRLGVPEAAGLVLLVSVAIAHRTALARLFGGLLQAGGPGGRGGPCRGGGLRCSLRCCCIRGEVLGLALAFPLAIIVH